MSKNAEPVVQKSADLSRHWFRFWRPKSVSRSSGMRWQGRPGIESAGLGRCRAADRRSPIMASFFMPLPLDAPAGAVPELILLTADDILPYI